MPPPNMVLKKAVPFDKPPRKKPGPKPKPYSERQFIVKPPVQRIERSYSKEKEEEVIMYMIHHRVIHYCCLKRPNCVDAEKHFKIPRRTIANWWKKREVLFPHLEPPKDCHISRAQTSSLQRGRGHVPTPLLTHQDSLETPQSSELRIPQGSNLQTPQDSQSQMPENPRLQTSQDSPASGRDNSQVVPDATSDSTEQANVQSLENT
ncbi:hypothetical protein EDB81DRAFT_50926 [Dactylonectria macrodidyma]|uniref:Uncharacterized protein n=1 Tax=Dactylonectria macrodidyma TaxID=307937 RepID=A0A9P9FV90_9HYPO|nr:hypothetical protein EDB81DRAFT_50926 [Dactylonectria macrodidyma]